VTPLDLMALFFASVVHDFDHPGVNNNFLIATSNRLALLYNDRSVLESYHLAKAFRILSQPECNFLQGLSKSDWQTFRESVIDMVLATDLSQHYATLTLFKTRVCTYFSLDSIHFAIHTYTVSLKRIVNICFIILISSRRLKEHAFTVVCAINNYS
jgi:hypothetical protein